MRCAVVGSPIAHSRSPLIHRAAYAALGLSGWTYQAVECGEAELAGVLADGWAGLSVTMPLKRRALELADAATDLARGVGAANTLLRRDGRWVADNTDVAGILGALAEAGVRSGEGAVVLGAGGTALAVLAALVRLGEPAPTVLVRDRGRAGDLLAAADRLGARPRIREGLADPLLHRAPLVISTLPAGAADGLAAGPFTRDGVLLDVLYHPWPTPLAAAAVAAGRAVVGGREMLLHQAVGQVEAMTGRRPAPVEAMRAALFAAAP